MALVFPISSVHASETIETILGIFQIPLDIPNVAGATTAVEKVFLVFIALVVVDFLLYVTAPQERSS